jgi:DNA-directed RNA polymerase subunit H (RpoH/RPB5)
MKMKKIKTKEQLTRYLKLYEDYYWELRALESMSLPKSVMPSSELGTGSSDKVKSLNHNLVRKQAKIDKMIEIEEIISRLDKDNHQLAQILRYKYCYFYKLETIAKIYRKSYATIHRLYTSAINALLFTINDNDKQ